MSETEPTLASTEDRSEDVTTQVAVPAQPTYAEPVPVAPPAPPAPPTVAYPTSALPASAPGYPVSGYAAGYPAPAGYAPAPYASPTPAKRGKAAVIVLSILTALFVLTTAGMTVLFVASQNSLSNEKHTVATQQSNIADLTKTNNDTATELSNLKSSSQDQISQLKSDKTTLGKCANDVDTLVNLPNGTTVTTFDKDWKRMVADCAVAKALSD